MAKNKKGRAERKKAGGAWQWQDAGQRAERWEEMQSRGKYRCIGDRASYGASRKRASFQGTARGLARLRWARPSQAKTALSPLSIATLDILAPTAMPTAARRSLHPLDASAYHAGRAYGVGGAWVRERGRVRACVCVCA